MKTGISLSLVLMVLFLSAECVGETAVERPTVSTVLTSNPASIAMFGETAHGTSRAPSQVQLAAGGLDPESEDCLLEALAAWHRCRSECSNTYPLGFQGCLDICTFIYLLQFSSCPPAVQ
jgi:hypothetical protein